MAVWRRRSFLFQLHVELLCKLGNRGESGSALNAGGTRVYGTVMRVSDVAAGLVGVGAGKPGIGRSGVVVPAYMADDMARLVAGFNAIQWMLRLDERRHGQAPEPPPLRSHNAPAVRPLSARELCDHAENASADVLDARRRRELARSARQARR